MIMSHTPIHTPVNKKNNKKLPMIVDVAIDDNGKQLYQVHESSKFIRKEMPRSTNFNSTSVIDTTYEEKTPIRKILGMISPSTLNQKKIGDDTSEDLSLTEPESATRMESLGLGLYFNDEDTSGNSQGDMGKNNDIWSEEVEQAFEEVLSIIPKNGLNKIKISGRSCGRNELISDYILTKTGKFRTRKQVSSHIQVIKNLGQKHDIIKLINDGPTFDSEQAQIENTRKFEKIFLKINLDKSLGFNKSSKRKVSEPVSAVVKKPKKTGDRLDLVMENFFMSVYDSMLTNPIILTYHGNQAIKELELKANANISNRFPDLTNLKNFDIPVLHNLVKILLPADLPINYSIENGLKTNMLIKSSSPSTNSYSLFTIIYNYGKEYFKINESNVKLNENYSFLNEFWVYFLNNEITKGVPAGASVLNHLTIKQILYENNVDEASSGDNNILKIPKLKIKFVLLWEFLKVDDPKDAITTTSKLTLPDEFSQSYPGLSNQIVPQVINYTTASSQFVDSANTNHISTGTNLTAATNTAFTPTNFSSVPSIETSYFTPVESKPPRKFNSLPENLPQQVPQNLQQQPPIPGQDDLVMLPVNEMAPQLPNQVGYSQPMPMLQMNSMNQYPHLDYDYQFLYSDPNYQS